MLIHVCLLLTLASPQGEVRGRDGRITLPRPESSGQQQPGSEQRPRDAAQEQFHREVLQLRRSLFLPASKEEAILQRMGERFDRIPERCLALVRTAEPDLAYGIMRVLETYGGPDHADELEFLLLTRSFGSATEVVVETMAKLAREESRDHLFSCLTASRPAVRRYAEKSLDGRLRPEDADRLIGLTREASEDVRVKSLRLLGAIPGTQPVIDRLVQGLGEGALPAEASCRALERHGESAVPALQDILRRPAMGRNFGYATLTLVGIEERVQGAELFTEDMVENLLLELGMPDRFQRSAVALALAGVAWRSDDVTGERFHDKQIVDALVAIVAPTQPIAHLSLLQRSGQRRLMLFVGQDFGASTRLWRNWWEETRGEARFVGARRHVNVTVDNAALASLNWTTAQDKVFLLGERAGLPEPDPNTFVYLLSPEEFVALVEDLRRLGFMEPVRLQADTTDGRVLRLSVGGAATRTDPHIASALLDRFGARVDAVVRDQIWQLYRDAEREPDFAAFWRAERRWAAQHEGDDDARYERLKNRILSVFPRLDPVRRSIALEHLAGIPDLSDRLTEEDGLAIAESARNSEEWDDVTIRILELAMLAPGEKVWAELVAIADARDEQFGGRDTLARIFGLIGPDRVLESIQTGTPRVRQVAIEEVSRLRDLRAVEPLLVIASDAEESLDMRRTAVYALGQLGSVEARERLIALLEEDIDIRLKRTTWVALGRIGGDEVFAVLQGAFPSPEEADRRAIVQSLGEMRHPRASRELADIYVLRGEDSLGLLALEQLRRQGDLLASPALVPHLSHPNVQIRRQIARLLGEFQNPAALPELLAMISEDAERLRMIALIAGITGQDVTGRNDRVDYLRAWYAQNRGRTQGEWLILALDQLDITYSLRSEQLGESVGTGAIPELTRLVLEAEQPWIRSLAARMLRVNTGQDFGSVTALTPESTRVAICQRYSALFEQDKAASGR